MTFNGFSPEERAWLTSQKLGRRATVRRDIEPPADGFSREVVKIHPDWVKSFNLPSG